MKKFLLILILFASCAQVHNSNIDYKPPLQFNRSVDGLISSIDSGTISIINGETIQLKINPVKKNIAGFDLRMFGYNSQIPGPLIRVHQGDKIFVNVTNNLELETTVHWHGIRLDNKYDGVPDLTQKSIKPKESFLYELKFPDPGVYWYHPHVREDYQQELGLYGNILVEPKEGYFEFADSEQFIFLDDILISGSDVYSYSANQIKLSLMGRFGNHILINGLENFEMKVKSGEIVRLYLTNAANTRNFRIKIPGAKMKLIASDNSAFEKEQFVEFITIAPAERYIVDAVFDKEGNYDINNDNPIKKTKIGTVIVSGKIDTNPEYLVEHENQIVKDELEKLRKFIKNEPDVSLKLFIDTGSAMQGMRGAMASADSIEWEDTMAMMNQMSSNFSSPWQFIDLKTGKVNDEIDYKFKIGDMVKIKIYNDKDVVHPMAHPIHFHGNRFAVLAVNGKENSNLVWKDTVLIPIGDTYDLILEVTNPGEWMAHCHIAEHLQSGMMMIYEVN